MIHGSFDFFFATGGNGAEGAGAGAGATGVCMAGVLISPVVTGGGWTDGGGGVTGGGGGGAGAAGCRPTSAVFGAPVGAVVGPVLRGSATVAG